MSKVCVVCGKKPQVGNEVSHAHNLTKRRFYPNLHKMKIEVDGTVKRSYVCTHCLRAGKVKKVV
ncbi:MAG: 50S ribosomal protein L28 [Candidatus Zhuqueibacterota bacterium]